MTTPFALAQQAANLAYDMTLAQTGDGMQASDDYKAVMSKYNAATDERPGYIVNPAAQMWGAFEWEAERGAGCAGNSADEYDSGTEGHW